MPAMLEPARETALLQVRGRRSRDSCTEAALGARCYRGRLACRLAKGRCGGDDDEPFQSSLTFA